MLATITEALGRVGAEVVVVKASPDELDATGIEVETLVTVAGEALEPSENRRICTQDTYKEIS